VLLWRVATFQKVACFDFHSDTILDVVWKDFQTFATASADFNIGICSTSGTYGLLQGHTDHVNAIAYNKSGAVLASASADGTLRLWRNDESIVLRGHESGVSAVEWIPGSDTTLVSGSVDGAMRIWDAVQCECLRLIQHHEKDIFAISMSPNGEFVASGSRDSTIVISNVANGDLIVTFTGNSDVYDVRWDPSGRFVAATFDDSTVSVIPVYQYLRTTLP
jgi:WD40 repeat protein